MTNRSMILKIGFSGIGTPGRLSNTQGSRIDRIVREETSQVARNTFKSKLISVKRLNYTLGAVYPLSYMVKLQVPSQATDEELRNLLAGLAAIDKDQIHPVEIGGKTYSLKGQGRWVGNQTASAKNKSHKKRTSRKKKAASRKKKTKVSKKKTKSSSRR